MNLNLQHWLNQLLQQLHQSFPARLCFVGLQGSRGRGEASPQSDIDVVVILDTFTVEDLKEYRNIISRMPESDKACGFVSGSAEISHWPKHDLFTFYYDTKPLYGRLNDFMQPPDTADAYAAAKAGAANLYHQLCHTFLHGGGSSMEILKDSYKHTFFILQALYFVRHHTYIQTRRELSNLLPQTEKEILDTYLYWPESVKLGETHLFQTLISWCSSILQLQ